MSVLRYIFMYIHGSSGKVNELNLYEVAFLTTKAKKNKLRVLIVSVDIAATNKILQKMVNWTPELVLMSKVSVISLVKRKLINKIHPRTLCFKKPSTFTATTCLKSKNIWMENDEYQR
jgi:hypothetical protein